MSQANKISTIFRKRRGLLIIITAALLLELISAAQYYYTRQLMTKELEKRAESELTLKAIIIKSTLNSAEDIMKSHIWNIQQNLSHPDSMFNSVRRIVTTNRYAQGGFVAFVPGFYPSKGLLFEPYARKTDAGITITQLGGENHDYRESDFYKTAISSEQGVWVDPYVDDEGAHAEVISYVTPLRDSAGETSAVVGIDLTLNWLSDTLDYRHIYPSSFDLLLTEDGKPITHPSERRISAETTDYITQLINDSSVTRRPSRSGRTKTIPFKHNGKKGVVYYANMKGKPHWQIAVVCYDDEVYGALNSLRVGILCLMLLAFGILLYMVRKFARSEGQLNKKTLEQERMNNELRIANGIQQALLPDEPSLANANEVKVHGTLIPAKTVGGDLYNAFVRNGKLFFCIGDVSGKGVPSALIMAITHALFRNIASREDNPAHIMQHLNETACRNNKANFFVTIFIGVLDLPTGRLRYCNAGHEVPILIEPSEADKEQTTVCTQLNVKPNLPIGLFDYFHYEMQEIYMKRGTTLFLYTDGLTEARNAQNELFGMGRVIQMIKASSSTDPKELVDNAIEKNKLFVGDAEPSDDLTLLVFRYSPDDEPCILDERLTLKNNIQEVKTLNQFVEQVAQRLHIDKPLTQQLRLAVEEAVVNVMDYAYPAGTTGHIDIRATSNGHRLTFCISDSGNPFNPTEAATPDITLSAEERPIGGLGIMLIRKLMDSINYERTDGKNILTISKGIKN